VKGVAMTVETVSLEEFQSQSDGLLRQVAGRVNRIAVARDGKIVAALVSADDLEQLEEIERRRDERRQFVESIREKFSGIPEEELIREAEKAVREARDDMSRARRERAGSGNAMGAR
jgi:PHD/YefM family antitoxin component YafN of YafNO toxin-antitoxin module